MLEIDVDCGTRQRRCLVLENTLSGLVVAVNEVADNSEMFFGGLRVLWNQRQTFLAERVHTAEMDLLVRVIIWVGEVGNEGSADTDPGTKELRHVSTSDDDLDWVVIVGVTAHPVCSSHELVTGNSWTRTACFRALVPAIVAIFNSVTQQKCTDTFQTMSTTADVVLLVVAVTCLDVIDAIVDIVKESLRVDLLGLLELLVDISDLAFETNLAQTGSEESWLEQGS